MSLEGFSEHDFSEQKKNRWELQGKDFFATFTELYSEEMYKRPFGMMSE